MISGPNPTMQCQSDYDRANLYRQSWFGPNALGTEDQLTLNDEVFAPAQTLGYVLDSVDNGSFVNYNLMVPVNSTGFETTQYGSHYHCQLGIRSGNIRASAWLIILQSDPVCTRDKTGIMLEGETIKFSCQVGYTGQYGPKMQFKTQDDDVNDNVIDESGTNLVKFTLMKTIEIDNNEDVFSCDTSFGPPPVQADYATNTPDYANTFSFDALSVHWGPRDVQIEPPQVFYNPGDILTCEGSANPAIKKYLWQDMTGESNDTIGEEKTLTLTSDWLDKGTCNVRCTVYNMAYDGVQQSGYRDVTLIVVGGEKVVAGSTAQDRPCSTFMEGLESGAVVGIVFAVFIIGVMLTFALWMIIKHKTSTGTMVRGSHWTMRSNETSGESIPSSTAPITIHQVNPH